MTRIMTVALLAVALGAAAVGAQEPERRAVAKAVAAAAVNLNTARAFLGLSKDLTAKRVAFVCTVADASSTALLAGTPSVEYDVGVLPFRNGEVSLRSFLQRLLRDYRDRR